MAERGSKKELSVRHEQFVADAYGGRRSKSSGASIKDKGDVRVSTSSVIFECKMTMQEKKPGYIKQFEKVANEAYEEGKTPMMALRFYDPNSVLADRNGWIDLVMMRLGDAREREEAFVEVR